MALLGYQIEKEKIEGKIREIQAELKGTRIPAASGVTRNVTVKRVLSPAARARIAAAQKKRWAEFHKRQSAKQERAV
jgi:hypothetical protein